jgi:concanavalin A-like lectin/glucanase superfamily protein/calcineurin-like phosphoesterase family protein
VAIASAAAALGGPASAAADPVIAAAGDIACDPGSSYFNGGVGDATHCRQQATSDLVASGSYAQVLPLGDTQYEDGTLTKFQNSYDLSWGRVRSASRPAVGNHEYESGAAGYFDYFNGVGNPTGPAGDRSKGYYSFDVYLPSGSRWHVIALNSECGASSAGTVGQAGACNVGSTQEQWLRADLAANPANCTLAYWHHPLFSSGGIGNNTVMQQIWQDLYDAGAEVVLNGHDHNYERFAPQNPIGAGDSTYGMREFVVGTGGKSLLALGIVKPNSEVRQNSTFGVMELSLHDSGYDWRFTPEAGQSYTDSGSAACHNPPPRSAPAVSTVDAGSIGANSAKALGRVNPKDQDTTYRFQYGTTTSYGLTTSAQPVTPTDNTDHEVVAGLSGLASSRTYHYRVVATNGSGTSYGQDRTFTTAGTASTAYSRDVLATTGLTSYWRLGEAAGTTAADSRNRYAGTYRGGYTLAWPGVLFGDTNTATAFDGATGEMTASGPSLSTSGSLEGWFYWQRGGVLLRDNSSASTGGWILAWDNAGTLYYRVAGKSFNTGRSADSYRNAWHHFVLTKSAGSVSLYIDGTRVHSGTGAANTATAMPWHLMRNGTYSDRAGGRVDELAVYGSALSASQVARHYSLGRGG